MCMFTLLSKPKLPKITGSKSVFLQIYFFESRNQEQTYQRNHRVLLTSERRGGPRVWFGTHWSNVKVKVMPLSPVWLFEDPLDCSPPGTSIHEILQARILHWVAISFSRGSSRPRDWTQVSGIAGRHFNFWATKEDQENNVRGPGGSCGVSSGLLLAS